MMHQVSIQ